ETKNEAKESLPTPRQENCKNYTDRTVHCVQTTDVEAKSARGADTRYTDQYVSCILDSGANESIFCDRKLATHLTKTTTSVQTADKGSRLVCTDEGMLELELLTGKDMKANN